MMLVGQAVSITYTPMCGYVVFERDRALECGRRAVSVTAYACRHEHVLRYEQCAQHADCEEKYAAEGVIYCPECDEAPDGHAHHCTMSVRIEPLPEPKPTPLSGPVYVERLP